MAHGLATSERFTATFASLLDGSQFRRYFLAQFVSNIGTRMQMAGTAWLVLVMTDSPVQMGTVLAAEVLPIIALGPLAGKYVDRYEPRFITICTQLALALVVSGIALAAWSESYVGIVALSLAFGIVAAIDGIARNAVAVAMIEPGSFRNAMALNSVSANGSALVGPAVAGLAIGTLGAPWCFMINAGTFVGVAAALATIHAFPNPGQRASRGSAASPRHALRYLKSAGTTRDALIMTALIATFTYEFPITLPLLTMDELRGDALGYGILLSASGLGAILGGLQLAGNSKARPTSTGTAALSLGACVLALAVSPSMLIALVIVVFVGASSSRFIALAMTQLFADLPPDLRGRVSSFWQMATVGTTLLGGPAMGLLASALDARWALAVGAAAAIAAGTLGLIRSTGARGTHSDPQPAARAPHIAT